MRESGTGTIAIRGVEHYYEWICQREGDRAKPVMVFLHGWGGSGRYWRSTATALADAFDCLIYDLRGFGRSLPTSRLELAYDLEAYAEELVLLLEALKLERVYLNAHSMGASIAAIFLSQESARVEKAILTCSGIFEYNPLTFGAFHRAGALVVKLRFPWYLQVPGLDRLFAARFLHRAIAPDERRLLLEDYLLADAAAAEGTIYTAVSKHAAEIMPGVFSRISVPTLLVAGEKDIIIPAALGRKAAALSELVEYCEIPRTAHFPMLEDAPTYLQNVRSFLGVGVLEARV